MIELNNIGAERLLLAIYTCVCSDLLVAYKHVEKAKKDSDRRAAEYDVQYLETWIRSDPYGFLPDAEGIIQAVQKRYRMGGRSVKCPEFAKRDWREEKRMEYRDIRLAVMSK